MNNPEKCPNAAGCQVLHVAGFVESDEIKEAYRANYCSCADKFPSCKRFQTKKALGFCPDFVFPDSTMTLDEIMEKCEE